MGTVVGDEDDEVLWEIHADGQMQTTTFVVGSAPAGFDESVPFTGHLPRDQILHAYAESSRIQHFVEFVPRELEAETLLDGDQNQVTASGFEHRRPEQCDLA